jgi:hypothetical protein
MKLAVKLYSQLDPSENPQNIPGSRPALVVELGDSSELPDNSGWSVMTLEEYHQLMADTQAEFNVWQTAQSRPKVSDIIKNKIESYRKSAPDLLVDLYVTNTLAGITVEQSAQMFIDYRDILNSIREGAWPTALYLLGQAQPIGFVTQDLINNWITKIQSKM